MSQSAMRTERVDVEKHWQDPGPKALVRIQSLTDSDQDVESEIVVERGPREWTFHIARDGVATLVDDGEVPDWVRDMLLNAGVPEVEA